MAKDDGPGTDDRNKRKDVDIAKLKAKPLELPKKVPIGNVNVALPPVHQEGIRKESRLIVENRYRDELPEVQIGPRMLPVPIDFSRYADCKQFPFVSEKPELLFEADLGLNLEPMDAAQYRVPPGVPPPMDPADEALFAAKVELPPVRQRKYGQADVNTGNWLMRTIYMADAHVIQLNADENSLIRQQRKRLKRAESTEDALASQVQQIEASFRAMQSEPKHVDGRKDVQAVEILPIIPDFARWPERHCVVSFESDPLDEPELLRWVHEKRARADKSKRAEDREAALAARTHASKGAVLAIKALQDTRTNRLERFLALLCPKEEEGASALSEALGACRETEEGLPYEWLREFTFDQKREAQWDEPSQMLALFAGGSHAVGDRLQLGSTSRPEGHTLSYVPVEKRLQTRRRVRRQGPGSVEMVEVEIPREVTVKRRAPTADEEDVREAGRRRLEHPEEEKEAEARAEEEERAASPPQRGLTPPPEDEGEKEDLFGDDDA